MHLQQQENTTTMPNPVQFAQGQGEDVAENNSTTPPNPRATQFSNTTVTTQLSSDSETNEQDECGGAPSRPTVITIPNEQMHILPETITSLNAAIKKININERDMKSVLQQTKALLENKLSEMDQRLEKADNIVAHVNNTSQSLVQLQTTYPWLQVKLRVSPHPPTGACSVCLCKYVVIAVIPACRIG